MNIYITVGISGSGKSTYQKKHLPNQRLQFEGAVKTAIELAENSVNNPRDKYEIILEDV